MRKRPSNFPRLNRNESHLLLCGIFPIHRHDVWAQLPAKYVYEQYQAYPFGNSSGILAAAEKNCWPGSVFDPHCANLPESPLPSDVYGDLTDKINPITPLDYKPASSKSTNFRYNQLETRRPKYINSGSKDFIPSDSVGGSVYISLSNCFLHYAAVIGKRNGLQTLFSAMSAKLDLVQTGELNPRFRGSDQELMTLVNLHSMNAKEPHAVLADGFQLLFQVVAFSYKDLIPQTLSESKLESTVSSHERLLSGIIEEDKDWTNRSVIYNHISHTVPSFLHFPGPKESSDKLDFWWKLMWWMQPSGLDSNSDVDHDQIDTGPSRPADSFLELMEENTDEELGYGAKLADGTWMSYKDLCSPYKTAILG